MVPSTVDTALATKPMMSEFQAALSISSLPNSLRYQSSVKPTHCALRRESLNEYDHDDGERHVQEQVAEDGSRPQHCASAGSCQRPRPPGVPGGEPRQADRDDSQHHRQHAAERPVAGVQELLLRSQLPIMMPPVPPRMSGMAKMPNAGMNTSAAPANTPGRDSGKVTPPEALPGVGAQVLSRVQQRRIVLFQVGVQRQAP